MKDGFLRKGFIDVASRSAGRLAARTIVGAALPDHDASNRSPAHRAGPAFTLVDAEVVLEISAPVDPIEAGAVVAQAGAQRRAPPKTLDPGRAQGITV
jgi:hypothetical protein